MAQPILLELPPRDPREALYDRLKNAPHEHAEALLNLYDILQELQDRGVLELAKGALGSSEKVLGILVNFVNKPEMIRGIRNLIILANVADSLGPELLESLQPAIKQGLTEARKANPDGFWQIAKMLLSQQSRRVLILAISIMQSVGKRLSPSQRLKE
jgi:uncharacterized protein YjgD (DUF1641 family)